jgi:hypothetical protein
MRAFDERREIAASDCPNCAAWFAAAHQLEEGLRKLAPPIAPLELPSQVAARVQIAWAARRRRRWIAVSAVAAVAAAVILAVGVRFIGGVAAPPQVAPAPGPVVQKEPTPRPPPADLRSAASEAGDALSSLTAKTADETVGKTKRLLQGVDPSLGRFDLQPPLEPPTRPFREAGEGFSSGLEPVTTSARRAIRLFFENLPSEKMDKPDL